MKKKPDKQLLGLKDAAALAKVNRNTIMHWEQKGWIKAVVELSPRPNGRPGKLYDADQIRKVAIARGREVDE
jgi:hypothetical protein